MIKTILEAIVKNKPGPSLEIPVDDNADFKRPYFNGEVLKFGGDSIYAKASSAPYLGFSTCVVKGGMAKQGTGWASCREVFAGHFTKMTETIFFGIKNFTEAQSLAYFFHEIERQLGHKDNVSFQMTDCNNLVVVHIPAWWRKTYARRQLFTILLRCGVNYAESFDKALVSNDYASNTKAAVKRFLNGYTNISNTNDSRIASNGGWNSTFAGGKNLDFLTKD